MVRRHADMSRWAKAVNSGHYRTLDKIAQKIIEAVEAKGRYVTQTKQEYSVAKTLGTTLHVELKSEAWPYAPLAKRFHFYAICTK